jgi:hypothetical protein
VIFFTETNVLSTVSPLPMSGWKQHLAAEHRRSVIQTAPVLGVLLLGTSACDPTVNVVEPNDQYRYSLFGALDVAADTQVIRVDPLGDSIQIGDPHLISASVTLENLDTGTEIALRDSFAAVQPGTGPVHNFWTTHPIHPSTSYRISVEREEKVITSATTTTPANAPDLVHRSDFYLPCTFPPRYSNRTLRAQNTLNVTIRNVDQVAAAKIIYPIVLEHPDRGLVTTMNTFDHYEDVYSKGDALEVAIFYRPDLVSLHPNPPLSQDPTCAQRHHFAHPYALVTVSAAGPEWPSWSENSFDEIARPDSFSNVQGGHGYIAGVYSDTIKVPIRDRPGGTSAQ